MLLACGPADLDDPGNLQQGALQLSDGFDDPAGSGPTFFIEDYTPDPDEALTWALDIDGDGDEDRALNLLSEQYQLLGYDFSEFVRSGVILSVIEVAGLEQPYTGSDSGVTFKVYRTRDADQDYGNNTCEGEGCAQFVAHPDQLVDGQTLFRLGPAPIEDHHFRVEMSEASELTVDFGIDVPIPFLKVRVEVLLPDALDGIPAGVLCGAVPASSLNGIPLCAVTNGASFDQNTCDDDTSVAFVIARLGAQPDIDIDGDGLETYAVDFSGEVLSCQDGDGSLIEGPDCLSDPRIADGFSVCASFRGIPAELIVP